SRTGDEADKADNPSSGPYPLRELRVDWNDRRWHLESIGQRRPSLTAALLGFRWHRTCDRAPSETFIPCPSCGNLPLSERCGIVRPTLSCLRQLEMILAIGEDASPGYRFTIGNGDDADR